MYKNKRGQFFLIAALVIVTIIFSLGFVYNSATSSALSSKARDLSKEIKYESLAVIENCLLKCSNSEKDISERLVGFIDNGLLDYYARANSDKKIVFIFGEKKQNNAQSSFFRYDYESGKETQGQVTYDNGKIEATFNNQLYVFDVKQGYNVFVIVEENVQNEKTIASA